MPFEFASDQTTEGQAPEAGPAALVVDWGGVLTNSLDSAMIAWATEEQVDVSHFGELMQQWFGAAAQTEAAVNPVHLLERGEMEVPDFERELAAGLSAIAERPVRADGLLGRLFSRFRSAHDMNALVRRAREGGVRTALLSNSWGNQYPDDLFDGMFDAVVISGRVGMRKPEARIYRHTAELLALDPGSCVFVDDLRHNVVAAVDVGMIGIHHVDYDDTAEQLAAVFGDWVSP